MNYQKRILYYFVLVFILLLSGSISYAWDKEVTHDRLSKAAINQSLITPEYLEVLGLSNVGNNINLVIDLVAIGAKEEDEGGILGINARVQNHFHEPLSESGLDRWYFIPKPVPFWFHLTGASSVLWAQNPDNEWSWANVRSYFFETLTASDAARRDENFRKTFKGVGHQIHLIQDMAQPAHVRNDPHPLDAIGVDEGFEYWAIDPKNNNIVSILINSGFIPPDQSLFSLSPGPFPLRPLWDRDQYNGINPPSGTAVGLAEYTSANFFSEDTIIPREFPYPFLRDDMEIVTAPHENSLFGTIYEREYYLKKCCGETNGGQGYLLAAVDGLDFYRQKYFPFTQDFLKHPILDENVYRDYANFLLPRAVGYSTEIINYFFRGRMALGRGELDPNDPFGKTILMKVANETPGETATGKLTVVARYRPAGGGSLITQVSKPQTEDITLPTTLIGTNSIRFSFPDPIPEDAEDLEYTVAFKGTLGAEVDTAVMGKVYRPEKVLIIQDKLIMNSPAVVHNVNYDDAGDLCDGPEPPADCDVNNYLYHNAGSGFWKEWSLIPQTMSGHFIIEGDVREIKLEFEDYCLNLSYCTLYELPIIEVNGMVLEGGVWTPGSTPEIPRTWRVTNLPTNLFFSLDGTVYVDPYYGDFVLKVTMENGLSYKLSLAHFNSLDHFQTKTLNLFNAVGFGAYAIVSAGSGASMDIWTGFWETPAYFTRGSAFLSIDQLSGQGPTDYNNSWEDTGVYYILSDPNPHTYIHYLSQSLVVKIRNSREAIYSQAAGFFCSVNSGFFFEDGGCKDGPEEMFYNLSIPAIGPFSISGSLKRVYTERELAILSESGLPAESYNLTIQ